MLGKLMKHELKLTAAKLLPMYLVFFAITILARLTISFNSSPAIFTDDMLSTIMGLLTVLLIFLYVVILIALCIMTYFVILNRFYKNLLGDEGYLMFSLPVKTGELINSKLFTAFFWLVLLAPAGILSFLILFLNADIFSEVNYYTGMFTSDISLSAAQIGFIVAGTILASLLETIVTLLTCYLSMTLGQRFWHEHRLFGSILFYFGISAVSSAFVNITNTLMENITFPVSSFGTLSDIIEYYSFYLPGIIVVNLILSVLLYFFTHYLLDKKLNLN